MEQGKRRRAVGSSTSTTRFGRGSNKNASDYKTGTSCLSDSGLETVGGCFAKLEKLSLIWCSNVTDLGLRSFAEKCKSLKSLDLQVIAKKIYFIFFCCLHKTLHQMYPGLHQYDWNCYLDQSNTLLFLFDPFGFGC